MTRPAVSVIVPVFDVEAYLPACLDSLLAQTLPDIEIVVVNDGSTDGSQAIIDRYAREHPGLVRVFEKPNGGLGDARNFGIERASGEYLAFVDADDAVAPEMLSAMLGRARKTGADLVVCGIQRFADGEPDSPYLPEPDMSVFGHSLAEEPRLLYRVDASACNKLYARELVDRAGARFPAGMAFEDVPTVYPLVAAARRVEKVDLPLYRYRRDRAGSITAHHSERFLDLVEAFRLLGDRLGPGIVEDERMRDPLLRLHLTHLVAGRYPDFFSGAPASIRDAFLRATFGLLARRFPEWRRSGVTRALWPNGALRFVSCNRRVLSAFCRMPDRLYFAALKRLGAFDPLR